MVDASRMGLVCLLVYMGPFPLLWTMLFFPARRGVIYGFCQCTAGMAITGRYLCHWLVQQPVLPLDPAPVARTSRTAVVRLTAAE